MTTPYIKKYPIDRTGKHPDNRIINERHLLSPMSRTIVPKEGYFFGESVTVSHGTQEEKHALEVGVDYRLEHLNDELTQETGKSIFSAILLTNPNYMGEVQIDYQVYGTRDEYTPEIVSELLKEYRARTVNWNDITGRPVHFPFDEHTHSVGDVTGWQSINVHLSHLANILLSRRAQQNAETQRFFLDHQLHVNDKLMQMQALVNSALQGANSVTEFKRQLDAKMAEINRELGAIRSQSSILNKIDELRNQLTASMSKLNKDVSAQLKAGLAEKTKEIASAIAPINAKIAALVTPAQLDKRLTSYFTKLEIDARFALVPTLKQFHALGEKVDTKVDKVVYEKGIAEASKKAHWKYIDEKPELFFIKRGWNPFGKLSDIIFKETGVSNFVNVGGIPGIHTIFSHISDDKTRISQLMIDGRAVPQSRRYKVENNKMVEQDGWKISVTSEDDVEMNLDRSVNYPKFMKLAVSINGVSIPGTPPAMARKAASGTGINLVDGHHHTQVLFYGGGDNFIRTKSAGTKNRWAVTRLLTEEWFETTYPNFKAILSGAVKDDRPVGATQEQLNTLRSEMERYVPLDRLQSSHSNFVGNQIPLYNSVGGLVMKKLSLIDVRNPSKEAAMIYESGTGTVTLDKILKAADISILSDRRIKTDIRPLENALETVCKLEGKRYWNTKSVRSGIGFIAQDVEKVLPEIVSGNEITLSSVNYIAVIPLLVEAVKTLREENIMMRKEIEKLKGGV